ALSTHARSAADVPLPQESVCPSCANLGFLAGLGCTGRITLLFPGLGDDVPKTGLQARTTVGVGQAALRKLFGLGRIALSQAHLRQTIDDSRFTRRDTLRALKARRCTIEVAAVLLLLRCSQQRQHRAV